MVLPLVHARGVIMTHEISLSYTVWRVIFVGSNFRGKSEKALKNNYHGFIFVTATSLRLVAWHCCTSDDVINTRTRDLLCNTKPYLQRLGQKA